MRIIERVKNIVQKMLIKIKNRISKMRNKIMYGELNSTIEDKSKYKEFLTVEECRTWGEYYSNWAKRYKEVMSLTEKIKTQHSLETSTVECYCGYSYREINKLLRSESISDNKLYDKMADILIMALCSAPRIPEDIVVYRVIGKDFIEDMIRHNKLNRPTPIQEKGFMSTSLLKNIVNIYSEAVEEPNLLKIYVPKNTIGIYVNSITKRDEEEILIAPNNYLWLLEYPYYDEGSSIKIFECQLVTFV